MRLGAGLLMVLTVLVGCGSAPPHERSAPRLAANAGALSSEAAQAEARLLAQLAPRLEQSSTGLTPVTRQDGGRSLRLNGRFSQAQIARKRTDGMVVTTCVDSIEAAKVALRGAAQ